MTSSVDLEQLAELPDGEFLEETGVRERELAVKKLVMAYAWAVRHPEQVLDPAEATRPGREKARRYGGDGTPTVTEFAAAAFAARLGITTWAGAALIADALDLQHRFPVLWERVRRLEVRDSYARFVARRTRDLSREQAAYVDARVAESADGRIPWSRFEALVEGAVVAADVDAAREREERAARATFAKRIRTQADGMATFMIRADVATIEQIDTAVGNLAETLGDAEPEYAGDTARVEGLRRALANAGLAGAKGRSATLFVHVYAPCPAHPDTDEIARVEGHGAVTEAWIRRVLGEDPRATIKVQPVLDLADRAPVDAYEIPDRHRRAVRLLTPADIFPFASCTDGTMQIDHTLAHGAGGESALGNYGPMTTQHHRIKTHADWDVQQPYPGVFLWRDPYGALYLVDNTGTRAVPRRRDQQRYDLFMDRLRAELQLTA